MSGEASEVPSMGHDFLAEAEAEAAESAGAESSEPSEQGSSASDDVDAQAAELAKEALKGKKEKKTKPDASQVQAAVPPKPQPPAWQPKKLPVNGKEYEVKSLEQLESLARRGLAFMQRAEDINRLWEETQGQQKRMQDDLGGYLQELYSKDPNKAADVAERLLLERAQLAELERQNPAAAQAYRLQKELERRDAADKQRSEQVKQQELQQLERQQDEHLDKLLDAAITEGGLPKTTPVVRTMGHLLRLNLQRGIELTQQELVAETKEVLGKTYGDFFDGLNDEQVLDMLGPKRTERIRKALLAKAQRGVKPDAKPAAPKKSPPADWRKADDADKDAFEREIANLKRQAAKEMFRR